MAELAYINYSKNALNQVIIRIDFLQYIQSQNIFHDSIEKEILHNFPKRGKDQVIRFNSVNVVFNDNNNGLPDANGIIHEGIQREYKSTDGMNKIILSNKFLILEIKKYTCFNEYQDCMSKIVFSIFNKCQITIRRTGIRYINIFNQSSIKPQKNYFVPEIASNLLTKIDSNISNRPLVRSMHISEYKIDEMTLNFRYGMFNPEYPNIMKTNDFALDFDCFSDDIIDNANEAIRVIQKGHDEIQTLFEYSISDSLRGVMKDD